MAKWINSAREFLGLGEDPYYDDADEYDDLDDEESDPLPPRRRETSGPASTPSVTAFGGPSSGSMRVGSVRGESPAGDADWEEGDGGVRMITSPAEVTAAVPAAAATSRRTPGSDRGVVRPIPTASKPEVVSPTRFDDVQLVADAFKKVQPVIINLQGVDRDLSRRLIDFASGLCYGLEGEMERVAEQVFLLTPKGAEVSADDRRRLEEGGVAGYDS